MKKYSVALILFIAASSKGYSQSGLDKKYLSISAGPAFAVGSFASKNTDNESAGVAKTGQTINVSYVSLLNKNWGLTATLLVQRNPIDIAVYEEVVGGAVPAGSPQWAFTKPSWWISSLLAGGYTQIPLQPSGKVLFIAKAMVGAMRVASPKFEGNISSPDFNAHIVQSKASGTNFAYLLSSGIKYNCGKKLSFIATIDYLASLKIKFKDVKVSYMATYIDGNGLPQTESSTNTGEGLQTISTVNVSAGIAIRL